MKRILAFTASVGVFLAGVALVVWAQDTTVVDTTVVVDPGMGKELAAALTMLGSAVAAFLVAKFITVWDKIDSKWRKLFAPLAVFAVIWVANTVQGIPTDTTGSQGAITIGIFAIIRSLLELASKSGTTILTYGPGNNPK
jgi:hypothetical protein